MLDTRFHEKHSETTRLQPTGVRRRRLRVTRSAEGNADYWLQYFRCSARELAQAVKSVGDDPIDVAVYLERR